MVVLLSNCLYLAEGVISYESVFLRQMCCGNVCLQKSGTNKWYKTSKFYGIFMSSLHEAHIWTHDGKLCSKLHDGFRLNLAFREIYGKNKPLRRIINL